MRRHVNACGLVGVCSLLACSMWSGGAIADVRWTTDGNACGPQYDYVVGDDLAAKFERTAAGAFLRGAGVEGDEVPVFAYCPIPLGSDLIELTDSHSRLLDYVNVRFWHNEGPSGETFDLSLMGHDYDSVNDCICDRDYFTTSGSISSSYATLTLNGDGDTNGCDTDCNGGAIPSGWLLNVELLLEDEEYGAVPNTIGILYLRAYDT